MVLLPGMGADARLFLAQSAALEFTVPPWPLPAPDDSLQTYAARIASTLPEPPAVIGGASFGGMVAIEVAAIMRPNAVALMGSCATPSAIAPAIRALGRMALALPTALFRPRRSASPLLAPKFGELDREQKALFWAMAAAVPASFLRWACGAVLSWRPTPHDVPVFHIHGDRDRLIPVDRVEPTEIVRGAGHLLTLTHPAEVTAFLGRVVRDG